MEQVKIVVQEQAELKVLLQLFQQYHQQEVDMVQVHLEQQAVMEDQVEVEEKDQVQQLDQETLHQLVLHKEIMAEQVLQTHHP